MRRSPSRGQRSRNDQNLYNLSNLLKRMRSQQVSRGRCSNDKRYSSFGNSSISPTVSRPIIPSLPTTIKHPAVVQRFHMNYLPMMQLHPKDVLPSRQPTFNPTFQSNLLFPLGDLRNYRQSRHSVQEDFERRRHGSGNFILQRQRPEKQNFNNTAYCFAYFTIIIVGTKRIVIGGWGGGAFQINYNWDEKPCAPGIDGKHICERNYTDRLPHTIKCIETFEDDDPFPKRYLCLCSMPANKFNVIYWRGCENVNITLIAETNAATCKKYRKMNCFIYLITTITIILL